MPVVEHRFTDTQDQTCAGAWWLPNATLPEFAWMFDPARNVLIVTARTGATTEHQIVGKRRFEDDARRSFLPGLALHIGRRVIQLRK